MKVIIAGAGAVGTHVAKFLSHENYDIVVIEEESERTTLLANDYDLMIVNEHPASISALRTAGVEKADLFIGVTPDEAVNVTSCILAHKLGARKTVARVDNYEYILEENITFFQSMGINSVIFPEKMAAEEIQKSLRYNWVRQWWEMRNSDLIMIGVKLRSTAHILGIPLRELGESNVPYHVVAIKRNGETLIPHGNDMLIEGDVAYFMTTTPYIEYIQGISGKMQHTPIKSIAIVGLSSTAIELLHNLPPNLYVKIIDKDIERCDEMSRIFSDRNYLTIHGDARDTELFKDENLHRMDAYLSLTGNEELNILACLAAKRAGVPKTVAMIETLDYMGMAEGFDIGTVINKKTIAASRIYQMLLRADVSNARSLAIAGAEVAEFEVREGARITKKLVKDLRLPPMVNLGGLVRNGESMLINGMTQIMPGDRVMAFFFESEIKRLEKYFK